MSTILPESRCILQNEAFKILASSRGASLVSITPRGHETITRDVTAKDLPHGRASGLFCCGQVFGPLPDRTLVFNGQSFAMPYPSDIRPNVVDPDRLFVHGLDYLYTFEEQLGTGANEVVYVRSKDRLPVDYPFPHRLQVSYSLSGMSLDIRVLIDEVDRPTPVCPTVHPNFKYALGKGVQRRIQLQARLTQRFEFEAEAPLPSSSVLSTTLRDGGPYVTPTTLSPDRDHSHLSANGVAVISWPDGPQIRMEDLTPPECSPIKPLQIWTTAGLTRNLCGIGQGGPAHIFGLAEARLVPFNWRMIARPGQPCERRVRYTLLSD